MAWDKGKKKWKAYINYNKKQYIIITTKDKEEAIKKRKEAEKAIKNGSFEAWIKEQKSLLF